MFDDLKSLKSTYQYFKKMADQNRIEFLDSVVSYCDFLGFTYEKTMLMLALTRNILPEPGQEFTQCENYDDIDIEYNKKMRRKYEKL